MKKETLYLIGGSGFIGKNLVRCLSPFYGITVRGEKRCVSKFSRSENI